MSATGTPTRDDLLSFLSSTPLFQGLGPDALESLLGEVSARRLLAGEILFRRGDPGEGLYVVRSGWLRVFLNGEAGAPPKILCEIGKGEFVGEMALVTGAPRSASVGAVRDCDLVRLSREGFERLIEQHPRTMLQMLRELVQRMQKGAYRPVRATAFRTVAVIPVTRGAATAGFLEALRAQLDALGRAVVVRRGDAEEASGDETPEGEKFTRADGSVGVWLDRLEHGNRFVVYVADDPDESWTRCCVRQADRILYLAEAGAPADAAATAAAQERRSEVLGSPRRDLVLFHDGASAPRDTGRWLGLVPADLHHHVRRGRPADMERLVRILAGRANGLVLSGGGARGFAHLGVLRALEECGTPVDVVGGTSIGAVIAGLAAKGLNAAEIHAACIEALTPASALNDYTLPVYSLMRCRAIERRLAQAFGELKIEDLWLTYFCVSTDMTEVSMRVHREGPLAKAIRASIAVPGLYPPVIEEGHVLVDGAVMNNMPASVMRSLVDGVIIGVDVGAAHMQAVPRDTAEFPSPYATLWRRVLSRPARAAHFPNIFQTLIGSVVASNANVQEMGSKNVDFLLRPDIPGYNLTDWRQAADIAERGYAWARPAVEAWMAGRA